MSRGRYRRRKLAALATAMSESGTLTSPVSLPSYTACRAGAWEPDVANAHLQAAAAGRLTIGDPFHHAPPPIDFDPPGKS